jgi:hypothetical protein
MITLLGTFSPSSDKRAERGQDRDDTVRRLLHSTAIILYVPFVLRRITIMFERNKLYADILTVRYASSGKSGDDAKRRGRRLRFDSWSTISRKKKRHSYLDCTHCWPLRDP